MFHHLYQEYLFVFYLRVCIIIIRFENETIPFVCCEPEVNASRLVLKVGYAARAVSGKHVLVSYHTLFEFSSPSPTIPLWAKHRFLPR